MLIDCASCPVAGLRCDTCVVASFIETSAVLPLDRREAGAVQMFADLGLVTASEASSAHAVREPFELARRVG